MSVSPATALSTEPIRRPAAESHAAAFPVARAMFDQLMVPCYAPADFVPVRGAGSPSGTSRAGYIDFAGGVAVTSLGLPPGDGQGFDRAGAYALARLELDDQRAGAAPREKLVDATFAERVFRATPAPKPTKRAQARARR